jgi:hypothetical protein
MQFTPTRSDPPQQYYHSENSYAYVFVCMCVCVCVCVWVCVCDILGSFPCHENKTPTHINILTTLETTR